MTRHPVALCKTLTRRRAPPRTRASDAVTLYACGPAASCSGTAPARLHRLVDALRGHTGGTSTTGDASVESPMGRRAEARRRHASGEADALRAGIPIEDVSDGTVWRRNHGVPA
ncbi:hypothetical protein C7405_11112 [Paraburkholderia caballeronis]|nr:hypothetical protein C7405_11112 [Paraburkholderia caballeronis]